MKVEAKTSWKRFVYLAAAISALGGILFGYDIGVISGAILFIKKDFSLSAGMQEIVISSVLVGSRIGAVAAIGHRVVHGEPKYYKLQRITDEMFEGLHRLSAFDPDHMPEEILLAEAFRRQFPDLPQVACFDTAFHHDMTRVAQILPRQELGLRAGKC